MHPSLAASAARRAGVFRRADAISAGYSVAEIDRLVRQGQWRLLRRGIYVESAALADADGARMHVVNAHAVVCALSTPVHVSHRSAALVHGLPLLAPPPEVPVATVERQHRRTMGGVELHVARTPVSHRAVIDGLPLTSVARTVSDVARSASFAEAVVVADAALHAGAMSEADLHDVIADCPTWRGIVRTKRVAGFADPLSESPGESWSRVVIAALGFPAPRLQVELELDERNARVDFYWPEHRLVGEFDGRVKYGDRAALWDEKLREDRIRRRGYGVARWTWADLGGQGAGLDRILRGAFGRAA